MMSPVDISEVTCGKNLLCFMTLYLRHLSCEVFVAPGNFVACVIFKDCTSDDWGHAVAQLVETLRHKPEGHGFDSR